jgi:aryl-alcohol dehydrogenase-like predicted oxidoreductase
MNFGPHTTEQDSFAIMDRALELGVNFFDTANVYTRGRSEEILGRCLARDGKRDRAVVATKFTSQMGDGPNETGSHRHHIVRHVEHSLKRLGTDRIDLYYVHFMDLTTPVDETLRTLDDLVRSGKVLYIGTSKFVPSLTAEAIGLSERYGWARFTAEQAPYNLLDRSIEKELVWTCLRHGVGIVPWAPLGTGILSGQYPSTAERPEGSRFERGQQPSRFNDPAVARARALAPLAEARGLTLAQFALAWIHRQPGITSPILGIRKLDHLTSALDGIEARLTEDELKQIDEIAPPGTAVSDYWDSNTFAKLHPLNQRQRQ